MEERVKKRGREGGGERRGWRKGRASEKRED